MDPQACLQRLCEAIECQDRDEMRSASYDLVMWLKKDGFVPTVNSIQLHTLLLAIRRGLRQ